MQPQKGEFRQRFFADDIRKICYCFNMTDNKLVWQGWEGNEMYFFYDNTGTPVAFWYFPDGGSRVTGYYFTNQQGDVVRIEDPDGKLLASYVYDVWGKVIVSSGSVSAINPLKYGGYYHDTETGFYYQPGLAYSCLAACRRAYCFGVRP